MKPGDTILEVNGTPFSGMTHDEALTVNDMSFILLPAKKKLKIAFESIVLCMLPVHNIIDLQFDNNDVKLVYSLTWTFIDYIEAIYAFCT